MIRRDLRKVVVDVMMDFRFARAKALLNSKKGERRTPKRLSRYAEADEIITIIQTSKGMSKAVASAMSRFRMKSAETRGNHK